MNLALRTIILLSTFVWCAKPVVASANCAAPLELHAAFKTEARHMFFLGLWAKLDAPERAKLSWSLSSSDTKEMLEGVVQSQQEMAQRLARDRDALIAWVNGQGLREEIQVSEIPQDGSFVLFSTSPHGIDEIVCAARTGMLPEIFSQPGF
jgi:hypothetical protein